MGPGNQTRVTEFVIVGFTLGPHLQLATFALFLLIYLLSLFGNLVIIALTLLDYRFHTPMYFFLSNLAFLDIWFISSTVPKMLVNLVTEDKAISFSGCILQMYFYLAMGSMEFFMVAIMSVDRYVAICQPLRYNNIMNQKSCVLMMLGCWIGGFLDFILPTFMVLRLTFCGPNAINHFFCDNSALVRLACSETQKVELMFFGIASLVILSTLLLTIVSYVYIVITILRIPSATGRRKAFSTCASHFTVVTIVFGSCIFIYVRPAESSSLDLTKGVALLNSVITPFLNPFIYTLRNKKVKPVLEDISHRSNIKDLTLHHDLTLHKLEPRDVGSSGSLTVSSPMRPERVRLTELPAPCGSSL
ncbi:olfactory receptor 6F1-like [Microcaecilia unicolor]|uniref:Olfactory receptor n=1 Tax=Microcaecilia unicolor TaxID=1415580 RepID=A0A6P7WVV7_9AMPH|nr:olfactory receptor 6F1-like [Microcaecilia unicolor]